MKLSLPNRPSFGGGIRRRIAAKPAKRQRSGPGLSSRLDIRNTWQVVAGSILIPVGVAAILMGWYGAAHARVDQQQIPYLISGGLLGLGAIIAGALLYWAHWLYRIYDQSDAQHQEFMQVQIEIRDALLSGGAGAARSAARGRSEAAVDVTAGGATNGAAFVATASGSNFHRPDCPIVARHPRGLRAISERASRELAPCRICEPLPAQS